MEPELPLEGYYRGGPSYLDTYCFLKLYPDGYWIGTDGFDPNFDFLAFLSGIDIEAMKKQFPLGHYPRDPSGNPIYCSGRYTRKANFTGHNDSGVPFHMAHALILTTWDPKYGSGLYAYYDVVGPARLRPWDLDMDCVFVPVSD